MASSSSAAEMSMGVESTAQPPPPVADEREGEGEKELWEKKFLALKRRCDEFEQVWLPCSSASYTGTAPFSMC